MKYVTLFTSIKKVKLQIEFINVNIKITCCKFVIFYEQIESLYNLCKVEDYNKFEKNPTKSRL